MNVLTINLGKCHKVRMENPVWERNSQAVWGTEGRAARGEVQAHSEQGFLMLFLVCLLWGNRVGSAK